MTWEHGRRRREEISLLLQLQQRKTVFGGGGCVFGLGVGVAVGDQRGTVIVILVGGNRWIVSAV